ncbi:MAG: trypsin-like peptidase domain-containing protein [Leptolyngbya sp. SIO1E4]|nr:trypsin-like peptidase domain-containing protein [Leptolyngbya sp. SIO1E4]
MAIQVDEALYLAAIAQVCRGSSVVGVSFFVADGYLLTCAHVVAKALGHSKKSHQISGSEMLGQKVPLDYRECDESPLTAEVIYWRHPPGNQQLDSDIAVLKLQDPMPDGASILPLYAGQDYWDEDFRVLGFPSKLDPGGWAKGELMGAVYDQTGLVQMGDPNVPGYAIEPGFSGSPVWSPSLDNRIVGMTVARDKVREEAKVGFMIPILKLQRALNVVAMESLVDILRDGITTYQSAMQTAYFAALGDRRARFPLASHPEPLQVLRDNLATLSSVPPTNPKDPNALYQFVACLTLPALELTGDLEDVLRQWLEIRVADVQPLLDAAEASLSTEQARQATVLHSHLLLWVRYSPEYDSQSRYLVSALFVRDASRYDPKTGTGGMELHAPEKFRSEAQGGTVTKSDLEKVLQACLQEISAHDLNELTLELFLPIPLINTEVEHWDERAKQKLPPHLQSLIQDSMQIFPVGFRYRVVLRIAERIDSYFADLRSPWQSKWNHLESAVRACRLLKDVFIPGNCQDLAKFQTDLAQDTCLGMQLASVLEATDHQRLLLALVMTGAPAALWLRQELPKTQCKRKFNQLLKQPLGEIAGKVREARRDAFPKKRELHFGHHLALIWENPSLVPVEPEEDAVDQPLEMPS